MYCFTYLQCSLTRQQLVAMYLTSSYFIRQLCLIKRSINFGCNWQRIHTESLFQIPVDCLSPSSKPYQQTEQKPGSSLSSYLYLAQHAYFLYVSFPLCVKDFFFCLYNSIKLKQIFILTPSVLWRNDFYNLKRQMSDSDSELKIEFCKGDPGGVMSAEVFVMFIRLRITPLPIVLPILSPHLLEAL